MQNILLVDDDKTVLTFLALALEDEGRHIESYTRPLEALDRLRSASYQLVISDYVMPEMNGVALLSEARQLQPSCVRLLLSGNSSVEMLQGAINDAHIYKFIEKPIELESLLQTVEQALAYQQQLGCDDAG